MSQNTEYILIDHLDNLLHGGALPETDELIRSDKDSANEWHYLLYAVEGIREAGLYDRVSAVKKQYHTQESYTSKPSGGIVRSIYRNAFRVAACLFLLIGAATIYKYNSVSSSSIYNENYSSFELNTSRSSEGQDGLEQAYRAKNWQEVISLFDVLRPKSNKSHFLVGMAYMESKEFKNAINAFKEIIAANAKSADNYFQDEAEYYLTMSYLATNEADKAFPLVEKIKSDKSHLYNEKLKELSALDMKILAFKSSN